MDSQRNNVRIIETDSKLKKLSTKIKPVMKRIVKSTAVVCVSLTVNSLGAVANETCNKAGAVAKAAKSAKSSSRKMKRAAEIGSALIVCTNADVGVEDVITNKGSKPFMLIICGLVFVCGLMCGKEICDGG